MDTNWGIIGHQNIVKFLQNCLRQNRLAHAYLFYGSESLGKTVMAEKFASEIINQKKGQTTELYPLMAEADKKDISIEQVREWRRALRLKSFSEQCKVGIIYEAERLNDASANALLKIVEEPSDRTVIIIIASQWHRLLGTIFSRSLPIKFLPVSAAEIRKFLKSCLKSDSELENICRFAQGRPGVAVQLAQDSSVLENYLFYSKKSLELFEQNLTNRWSFLETELDGLKDNPAKSRAAGNFLDFFEATARLLLHQQLATGLNGSDFFAPPQVIKKDLFALLKATAKARLDLAANVQPKLVLENLLLQI